jgi:hypothetical protein
MPLSHLRLVMLLRPPAFGAVVVADFGRIASLVPPHYSPVVIVERSPRSRSRLFVAIESILLPSRRFRAALRH